jgi:hypothetical protein
VYFSTNWLSNFLTDSLTLAWINLPIINKYHIKTK